MSLSAGVFVVDITENWKYQNRAIFLEKGVVFFTVKLLGVHCSV